MKRLFTLLTAAMLLFGLTACGNPTPGKINTETLKVGIICATSAKDGSTEAAAYAQQIRQSAAQLGIEEDCTFVYDEVSTTNMGIAEEKIESCVQQGCAVIFGTDAGFTPALKAKAAIYPRVTFVGIGEKDDTLPNFVSFELKLYEAAYLAGITAGVCYQSDVFGMVTSSVSAPENCRLANAFLCGLRVQRPNATLKLYQTQSIQSESHENDAIKALSAQHCAAVLITTKGNAAFKAAAAVNMPAATVCTTPDDPGQNLFFSIMPQLSTMFVDTMQCVLSKETAFYHDALVGYADGFIQHTVGNGATPAANPSAVCNSAQQLFFNNSFAVFSGYTLQYTGSRATPVPAAFKDASGTVRIEASADALTPAQLREMTWLMEGITVL